MQGFGRNYRMRNEFKKAAVAVREIGGGGVFSTMQGERKRARPRVHPLIEFERKSSAGRTQTQRVANIRYRGAKGRRKIERQR